MDLPSLLCEAKRMVSSSPKWRAQLVAGLLPVLSPFLAVHHGARTCGRKKKESRVSTGVILGS